MRYSLSAARNYRGGIYVPPEIIIGRIRPTKKPTVSVGGVDVLFFTKGKMVLPPRRNQNAFGGGIVF